MLEQHLHRQNSGELPPPATVVTPSPDFYEAGPHRVGGPAEEDIGGNWPVLVAAGLDLQPGYVPDQCGRPMKNIWWDPTKRGGWVNLPS